MNFTEEDKARILAERTSGKTFREIAEGMNRSASSIAWLCKRLNAPPKRVKSSRFYWGTELDGIISEYNASEDMETRNRIYLERLHAPFSKMVECIFNRFKFEHCKGDIRSIKDEALAHLVFQLHNFKPEKGKSYSWASIVVKNFFILVNNSQYKRDVQQIQLTEERDDDESPEAIVLSYEDPPINEDPHIDYKAFGEYWKREYVPKLRTESQHLVARAFGNLIQSVPDTFGHKLNATYIPYISNATGVKPGYVCQIMRNLAPVIKEALNEFIGLEAVPPQQKAGITKETVEEVCRLAKEGMTQKRIGLLVGFHQGTVSRILLGKRGAEWMPVGFVWREGEYNPNGAGNPNAKLSRAQAEAIREDFLTGMSFRQIARKYDVSQPQVERICYGKAWGFESLPKRRPKEPIAAFQLPDLEAPQTLPVDAGEAILAE